MPPSKKCSILHRSIDLHMNRPNKPGEQAIAGKTSGLIELGETVTWRAKHFGIWQTLTSKITDFDQPYFFVDEMVKARSKASGMSIILLRTDGHTVMKDVFVFESPLGYWAKFLIG